MSTVSEASARCDARDLIVMALVEKLRHQGDPAHATAVASHIKGAPIVAVHGVMERLVEVGVLDRVIWRDQESGRMPRSFAVNSLGAEVMVECIEGWSPSQLEQYRRDQLDASAQAGRMRS